MVDLRKFLFHSDYPLEKIVGKVEGVLSSPNAVDVGVLNIPHGLPETPLAVAHWSFDPNFSSHQDCTDLSWQYQRHFVRCSTDRNNVSFSLYNRKDTPITAYVRAYLLPPYDSTADYSPPDLGLKWVLNTDLNYFKLVKSGVSSGGVVHHGLGYAPYVLAFAETSRGWERITAAHLEGFNYYPIVEVNENDIMLSPNQDATRIQYFIYGDA